MNPSISIVFFVFCAIFGQPISSHYSQASDAIVQSLSSPQSNDITREVSFRMKDSVKSSSVISSQQDGTSSHSNSQLNSQLNDTITVKSSQLNSQLNDTTTTQSSQFNSQFNDTSPLNNLLLKTSSLNYSKRVSGSATESPRKLNINLEKVFGVSFGGWLLLEPWITPSIFESASNSTSNIPRDEYTLTSTLGKQKSSTTLKSHWDTFFVEADVKEVAELGLNLIRVPIGYWAFELLSDDPYVQGQEEYLDRLIMWASKYNLKVQIDLHGMPGSQNGFDNSGKVVETPTWLSSETNRNLSLRVLNYIFDKYAMLNSTLLPHGFDNAVLLRDVIHSIEVVNEPFAAKLELQDLQDFYGRAYEMARSKGSTVNLFFQDGFLPIGSWDGFMSNTSRFSNITIDHHLYEIFSPYQISRNMSERLESVIQQGDLIAREFHDGIVGEFSGAISDCTKYINGVGKGARYDGTFDTNIVTGSCANHTDFNSWSTRFKEDTKKFIEVQFDTYATKGRGWIFWNFKTEDSIEWDFRKLHQLDMLPRIYNVSTYGGNTTLGASPSTSPSAAVRGNGDSNVVSNRAKRSVVIGPNGVQSLRAIEAFYVCCVSAVLLIFAYYK